MLGLLLPVAVHPFAFDAPSSIRNWHGIGATNHVGQELLLGWTLEQPRAFEA